jgi:hypothetical protein
MPNLFEENIESIIEIPNALVGTLTNIKILRVLGLCAFMISPPYFKGPFQFLGSFYASFWVIDNPSLGSFNKGSCKNPHKDIWVFLTYLMKLKLSQNWVQCELPECTPFPEKSGSQDSTSLGKSCNPPWMLLRSKQSKIHG